MANVIEKNRRFYDERVAPLIRERFSQYENRIAAGIAGEGSDCLGYDDSISRDHDFGTGVCLWLTDEDMALFGKELSEAYNELVDEKERSFLTRRLRQRRGVMTIHDFYSNILGIDCDIDACTLSEAQWKALDHSCLKTATNGEVFRDDLGVFTAFRNYLLGYYPDRIWRLRIAEELHAYASAFQTNYARCMSRGDIVSAELCKAKGIESAMQLFFLLKRRYAPYYKWTYRALVELDEEGVFAEKVKALSAEPIRLEAWEGTRYLPNRQNFKDMNVCIGEELASEIEELLYNEGMIGPRTRYLETHVDEVLGK